MKGKYTRKFTLRLTDEEAERLSDAAQAKGISKAAWIRDAVVETLAPERALDLGDIRPDAKHLYGDHIHEMFGVEYSIVRDLRRILGGSRVFMADGRILRPRGDDRRALAARLLAKHTGCHLANALRAFDGVIPVGSFADVDEKSFEPRA